MKQVENGDQEKLLDKNNDKKEAIDDNLDEEKDSKNIFTYIIYFISISLFLGITTLVITVFFDKNAFYKRDYFRSDNLISKPISEFRKYRTLMLKNGLEVVIISDPLSVKSAASLSVRVGANNDPDNLLGLAHFCEHMLFLGSTKYPNGDEYFKMITENKGHFNAYTDRELTNYFFEIHNLSFEKALDIFSRFFIDPLFNQDKVDKEVNSVNSEYEKNLIIDVRKRSQVFADLMNRDNPFHRFTTGNIETLIKNSEKFGLNLREELIKFYKKNYVSDKMKLIVYSNDDLEDIEDIIVEKFSDILPSLGFSNKNIVEENLNNKYLLKSVKKVELNNTSASVKQNINEASSFQADDNLNSLSKPVLSTKFYQFRNPFGQEKLGIFVKFNSISLERELTIHFIQNPLSQEDSFKYNPFYYFSYIFESKEDNSLSDILKKKQLANKVVVANDRDFNEWSDFSISINLTEEGMNDVKSVLQILNWYINYVKLNLVNQKNYDYLKIIEKLNFEYKFIHNSQLYETVSKLGHKLQRYPIKYLLNDIHFVKPFNRTVLIEYADRLKFDNCLIFLPNKNISEKIYKGLVLKETEIKSYESFYRTNYTSYQLDLKNLNENTDKTNIKLGELKMPDQDNMKKLISNIPICDKDCIENLKKLQISEPSLLNKTSNFEFWFKHEKTLDFDKAEINLNFKFDKYAKELDKINILILEAYLRRRIKKLNYKLKLLSDSITVSNNIYGLKIHFSSFDVNIKEVAKELVDRLKIFTDKEKNNINRFKIKDFSQITQDVHDHLIKDYNSQPWQKGMEYLKKEVLADFVTNEEYLSALKNVTKDSFSQFLNIFYKEYYVKLFVTGDIDESLAIEVFQEFNPILKLSSLKYNKSFTYSLKEKRKNRKIFLKMFTGNYLMRKIHFQESNKNNALVKCFKIGRNNYKNEIKLKLFDSIIGNVVFRELRINKQFGYVAKSKIQIFDNYLFFCIYVQGSSKLPHVIDDATIELLENTIKPKLEEIPESEFKLAVRKNFDSISYSRLDLSKVGHRFFQPIIENTYNFHNFAMIDKYSMGIYKSDMINFFKEKFLDDNDSLKFTVYQVEKDKLYLKAVKEKDYEEIINDDKDTIK